MNITRTTNPNGTYRYVVDGEVHYKASKVRYTHVSTFTNVKSIQFHKTEAAAVKNKGYTHLGWIKSGVVAIIDGDTPAPAPAASAPTTDTCTFCTSHPPYTPGDKIPADACAHWTTAETVDQRIHRYQLEGNEAAAIALSDRPSDLAAIDRAIDAGARWARRTSEHCYALALPGKLETLALIHDDNTVDFGSTLDLFRPATTPTTPDKPQATRVQLEDVRTGDTLRFVRIMRGFEYPGGEMKTLTETVDRVTPNTVVFTSGKRLTRKTWATAEVALLAPTYIMADGNPASIDAPWGFGVFAGRAKHGNLRRLAWYPTRAAAENHH